MIIYNSEGFFFLNVDYFSVKGASFFKLYKHATILTDNLGVTDTAFAPNSYTLDIAWNNK